MHPYRTGGPVVSVPQVVFPPHSLGHRDLVEAIRAQYAPLLQHLPGDLDYQAGFADPVRVALKMCEVLAIQEHPMHLPLAEITRRRGRALRNRQARDAWDAYAPLAAKQAMAAAHVSPDDIGAVVAANSTITAMPSLARSLLTAAGLSSRTEAISLAGEGCNGGAAAILRARDLVLAHGRPVLIVAGDYCSPWFYPEPDLRGSRLRGSILASALFADATAAAVMTPGPGPAPGFRIIDARSICLPGTEDALGWDDRHHFILSDAPRLVPGVLPVIAGLLEDLGWDAASLDVCTLHSGGNAIIKAIAKGLGLTGRQVAPAWQSLLSGNLMAAAVLHAMALAASDPALRPGPGGRGLLAGFGPGFAMSAAAWQFHDPSARRAGRQPRRCRTLAPGIHGTRPGGASCTP